MPRPASLLRFLFSSLRRSLCPLCSYLCELCVTVPLLFSVFLLSSCSRPPADPSTLAFVIESNPANLDPRFGSDAQSQRLSALLFDGLVERDGEMNLHPDLAESWETPTPLTYIFHLRKGVLSKREVRRLSLTPPTAIPLSNTFSTMKLAKPTASSHPITGPTTPARASTIAIPRKPKNSSTPRVSPAKPTASACMSR